VCGRFTVKATWAELVALYRLTMDAPPHNLWPRYNVCPTDPVDAVTAEREFVTMRWGLVPWWWSKPLKELRIATEGTGGAFEALDIAAFYLLLAA
jgi:putative SOS response-associated peptidase YedK